MKKLTDAQLDLARLASELFKMEYTYVTRDMRKGIPIKQMYYTKLHGTKQEFYNIKVRANELDRYWVSYHKLPNISYKPSINIMKAFNKISSYRNGLRNMGEFI